MNMLKKLLILIIAAPIVNGLVFTQLWAWFIIPVFHVDPITLVQAVGLMAIFSYFTYDFAKDYSIKETEEKAKGKNEVEIKKLYNKELNKIIGRMIGRAGGALLFGWIITLFM